MVGSVSRKAVHDEGKLGAFLYDNEGCDTEIFVCAMRQLSYL